MANLPTPFEGFCGPSYALENKYAAVERLVNWYPVVNESQSETKWRTSLAPCPGNTPFGPLPVPSPLDQPCRGLLELRDNVFGVNGDRVFHVDRLGAMTELGQIATDGLPVSMVANGTQQIFIASAERGYVLGSVTGAITEVTAADGFLGAIYTTFQDGYILNILPNSDVFQISGNDDQPVGDATKWSAANVSAQVGQADNLRAIISRREYVRLLGARRSQIYQNIGNGGQGGFPFVSYNSTFIETGIAAPFSLADLGDSVMWIGEDERGQRACWRDAAFQPQRVSNFAVEQFWQSYPTVADAVAFVFIWNGHMFYQVSFPTANRTWVYDATVSQLTGRPVWHERNYTNSAGHQSARSEMFHCYAYGRHLVGSTGLDGNSGAVYQYASNPAPAPTYDCGKNDGGDQVQGVIVCDRIAPHLYAGKRRVVYNRIEFDYQRGSATNTGDGSDPQFLLRWSNDAGNSFGNEINIPIGKIGEYDKLAYLNRCGYGRDRVFWLRYADPVACGIVGATLESFVCGS